MLKRIKALVREATPKKIREFFAYREGDEYAIKAYSQEGEDILLRRIFGEKRNGFYVDVGAHHPYRFSNTKLLYDRGWKGINIEPNKELYELFLRERKRDVNLNLGVALIEEYRTFYSMKKSAISTFSIDIAKNKPQLTPSSELIPVRPLNKILDEHLPTGTKIDLLTVDTEGLDLEVLQSNNWDLYKPITILVEDYDLDMDNPQRSMIFSYLTGKGYSLTSKLHNTCLYRGNRKIPK